MWWWAEMQTMDSSRRTARILIYCALLTVNCALTACGFTPMYGGAAQASGVQTTLNKIEIDSIPDREGQYLRNHLIDRFYTDGRPANPFYTLTFQPLQEARSELDITKSADATRAQLRITTTMTLTSHADGNVLLKRPLYAVTSYNVLSSQFTTRVSEDNARLNAIDDIARQAEQTIILFLKDRK